MLWIQKERRADTVDMHHGNIDAPLGLQILIIGLPEEELAIDYSLTKVIQKTSVADPAPLPVNSSFVLSYEKVETSTEH